MLLDEAALLRRARWAYELGRVRDAWLGVGWVFPAAALAAVVTGWSSALVATIGLGCGALVLLWIGQPNLSRASRTLAAPLVLLIVMCGPFIATC